MSTTINFTTVTNSIASLSISGVTVKDSDQIPQAIGTGTAVLCPRPDNFITGLSITRSELSGQNLVVRYTLNYQYFHCRIGANVYSAYPAMIAKLALIIVAFSNDATLSGALDNGYPTIGRIGPIQDSSGNTFHGCDVTMPITQFLEV